MKKFLFAAALGAITISGFAQDAKPGAGKMVLAGSLGYSSSKPEAPKNAPDAESTGVLTISPSFGYFVNDNLAIGARISFQMQSMKDMSGGTGFGIGAFGRYYKSMSESGNFQMFAEAAFGYQSSTAHYPKNQDPSPDPATGFGVGVAPGFGWYPGKNFGVEFTLPSLLAFQSTKSNKDATAGTSFQVGVSTLAQPVSFTILYFLN